MYVSLHEWTAKMKLSFPWVFHLDTFSWDYTDSYVQITFFNKKEIKRDFKQESFFLPFPWVKLYIGLVILMTFTNKKLQPKEAPKLLPLSLCVKKKSQYILFSYKCSLHHNR